MRLPIIKCSGLRTDEMAQIYDVIEQLILWIVLYNMLEADHTAPSMDPHIGDRFYYCQKTMNMYKFMYSNTLRNAYKLNRYKSL